MARFWLIIQASLFRLHIFWSSLIVSLFFIVPAIFDGLTRRAIQKTGEFNVSLNVYRLAVPVFIFAAVYPFVLLFIPVAISPTYVIFWTFMLALSMWFIASNTQHEV
jgi:hypothetical protein